MTAREEISDLSVHVNDFLWAYVFIHDYVFARSIRRIVPIPYLFEKINLVEALSALEKTNFGLQKCVATADNLVETSNTAQKEYLRRLIEYVGALRSTIQAFQNILIRLNAKLDGTRGYSWRAYRQDVAIYKKVLRFMSRWAVH